MLSLCNLRKTDETNILHKSQEKNAYELNFKKVAQLSEAIIT